MTETTQHSGAGAPIDHGTVDQDEVARFEALAREWWNPSGKFRSLHRFNPARIGVIRDGACDHFGRDPLGPRPLAGLALLDIGSGGGLMAEPMARLGAEVTAIDPSPVNIDIARAHAAGQGLAIDYRVCTAEALAATGAGFDIVMALEVVEHVADLPAFVAAAARLVKPGGLLFVATLNRTARAYALAVLGAEYVLGWLPRGTHDWRRFVTPKELAQLCVSNGLSPKAAVGLAYHPLTGRWSTASDTTVNYMLSATRENGEALSPPGGPSAPT